MKRSVSLLLIALLGGVIFGLSSGDLQLSLAETWRALWNSDAPPADVLVVQSIRIPRIALAMLVGSALAVAGAIAQAVLRNPLADPGLIGINAGGALAAMIVLVALSSAPAGLLPVAAFCGATLMAGAIYAFSWRAGTSSIRLLLIGVGLSALAGSATTFLTAFGDINDVQRALVWMVGSVYESSWIKVAMLSIWVLPAMFGIWLCAHHLDVLSLGDETARSVGQRVNLTRALMMLCCTFLSGAAIAASGLIGFVGLVAPHIGRRLVGTRHRLLIPVAALVGAALVLWADIAGRTIIAPAQLPVGLMIALLGAPFFMFLMWERRGAQS